MRKETLKQSSGDAAAVQQQLTELQAKYDTDTQALQKQLTDRDYADAMAKAFLDDPDAKDDKLTRYFENIAK